MRIRERKPMKEKKKRVRENSLAHLPIIQAASVRVYYSRTELQRKKKYIEKKNTIKYEF